MIEVEIQNFQSIEKVAFEINGFTALIGRSNIGKSATVRAMKCALMGAAGTDFVRHGSTCERRIKGNKKCKCKAVVMFKTSAVKVVWEKGDDDNQYTITKDGEETTYTAVNRGTPDFLFPDFEPVRIGDKADLLQVSDQFADPFLLKETGSTVADVLADVARLDDINVAMRAVGKDRKTAVSTRNIREKDVTKITAELDAYKDLDTSTRRASAVESEYDAIQVVEQEVEHLTRFNQELQTLVPTVRALGKALKPKLPDGVKLEATGKALAQLSDFYAEVAIRGPVIRRLKGVDEVVLPDGAPVQKTLTAVGQLNGWLDRFQRLQAYMDRHEGLDQATVPDKAPVQEALTATKLLNGWVDRLQQLKEDLGRYKSLATLPEPAAEGAQTALNALLAVGSLATRYERLTGSVGELGERLNAAEVEEKELLTEFEVLGVCPTCSLPVHPEHREEAV